MDSVSGRAVTASLKEEGSRLARYLLGGRDAVLEELERYESGCAAVFRGEADPRDEAILRFVARRPWSLPFLDAACAVIQPQALLRKKLLLLLAILETTPRRVDVFTPRPRPRWKVVLRLAGWGILSGLEAAVGIVIYPFARRAR